MESKKRKDHKRDYYKSFRKKNLESGCCVVCGKYKNGSKNTKCDSCIEIDKQRRVDKIKNGICVRCANKAIPGKLSCEPCSVKYRAARKEKRNKNKLLGLCEICSNSRTEGERFCEKCKAKQPVYRKVMKNKKRDKNLCQYCSSQKIPGMHCCKIHLDKLKEERILLKKEVVAAYGFKCACCGESNIKFLSIDHINNDGNEHRKEIGSSGSGGLYRWLKRSGYPKDRFQLLCFNCNLGKAHNNGVCPHKDDR